MGMMSEFKEFATKGNVMDMAVGIIIGGAFGKIISSFVNDVLMPPIGILMGGVDFSDLSFVLKAAQGKTGAVVIKYGVFLQAVTDFLIVAFAIFMMIRWMNKLQKTKEETPAEPPAEEVLLTEIRDLLKNK